MDNNNDIQRNNGVIPPSQETAEDAKKAQEPRSIGDWLRVNGPTLVTGAVLVAFLCYMFDPMVLLKVSVGLGFIIFIHELGHFLVAKWCDVHVTTFSIGFGPALPFCSYTWGETTYKLAVFPLGGYVQMVGQVDGDESSDGSDDDPRSYKNKPVWQRMAIISAGVTMNAIFACIAFTVIFLGPGKPPIAPVVAAIDSGKPAFTQGLRSEANILRVNDIENPYFDDLKYEVLTSLYEVRIVTKRDCDATSTELDVTPHQGSVRMIGISPTVRLQLMPKKVLRDYSAPLVPGSIAEKAEPGFQFDDLIIGMSDPAAPGGAVTLLPDDPRNPDNVMKDFFAYQKRLALLAGKDVVIRVQRGPDGAKKTVDIKVPPTFHRTLGVRMATGPIVAVREKSAAASSGGVLTPRTTGTGQKLEGDLIEKVEVTEPDGKTVTTFEKGRNLDPVRLPFQLKLWADRLWEARGGKPSAEDSRVKLYVKRHSVHNAGPVFMPGLEVVELPWDHDWRYDRVLPMSPSSPQAIPELGLAYQVKNQVEGVENDAAEAKLQKGDEIVDVSFFATMPDGTVKEGGWAGKVIKGNEWANLFYESQSPQVVKVKLKIKRGGEEKEIEVAPQVDMTWPKDDRGLLFDTDVRVEKADSVLGAIGLGFRDTHRSIMQVFLSLRGLATGRISIDNLGGPVTITTMAYRFAQYDFWEYLFFLGLISVNLAVLNFLPIPVLDGGHMVFLIYEKLRGKPASEAVRVGATYAGLLLLGCLMIFVLFLDIRRLVGG